MKWFRAVPVVVALFVSQAHAIQTVAPLQTADSVLVLPDNVAFDLEPLLPDFRRPAAMQTDDSTVFDASSTTGRNFTMVPLPSTGTGVAITGGIWLVFRAVRRFRHRAA